MMTAQLPKPPAVFVSYAREDEAYKDDLIKQLSVLEEQGVISSWNDALLVAGEQWGETIVSQVNAARIILLLISPDFMNSQYIRNVEMKRASERHEAGEVVVIPVLVRNVNSWENVRFGGLKLGELNALPVGAKFIPQWGDRDDAFANVAGGIQRAAEKLNSSRGKAKIIVNIPRPPVVGFVARRDEKGRDIVERLKEELAPQGNRLVTLSGPGGIGKTTLAAEAARALKEEFGGRIVWSSAEKRADFTLSTLLDDISMQLGQEGLRTLAPESKAARVLELMADAPLLIVLDNYETITADVVNPIKNWFTLAPCSALFTSRQKINSTLNIVINAMTREEAQDYLERIISQTQDAQVFSDEVRQSVYETAKANPYVMQWIVAQIDEAKEPRMVFEELAEGKGDAAERVFERSFNLPQLGDDGRATLLALSLFIPSASRSALAEVAGFGDDTGRLNEVVKNLRALWLIEGLDENRRFTIEGLTRSLARARLLKDERASEFRKRFVAYFLSYAESRAQPTPEDYDALELEKDNMLGAFDVAFAMGNWSSVMDIASVVCGPVVGMLNVRGYWEEAIRLGEQASTAAQAVGDEWSVAVFAGNAAYIRMKLGHYGEAKRAYEQANAAFRKLGSEINIAAGLHQLGMLAQDQGEIEEARRLYDESLEINRRLGNQRGIAVTLHQLGMLAHDQGELAEARRLYDESLAISKKLDNQRDIGDTLHQLAVLAQNQGDAEEARRLYNESLEIEKRFGNQSGIATSLHELGVLAQNHGDLAEARQFYDESLEIDKRIGNQSGIASTLHNLAAIAHDQGELVKARRLYNESLEIKKKLGNQSGIANTLHNLGRLAEKENNKVEAARLFREALGIFERVRSPYAEVARRSLKRVETEGS